MMLLMMIARRSFLSNRLAHIRYVLCICVLFQIVSVLIRFYLFCFSLLILFCETWRSLLQSFGYPFRFLVPWLASNSLCRLALKLHVHSDFQMQFYGRTEKIERNFRCIWKNTKCIGQTKKCWMARMKYERDRKTHHTTKQNIWRENWTIIDVNINLFVVCISKHSKKLFPNPCGVNVILWFLFCGSATISVACIWMEWISEHAFNKAHFNRWICFCLCSFYSKSIECAHSLFVLPHLEFFFYCSREANNKKLFIESAPKMICVENNNKNERKQKLDREQRSIIQNRNETIEYFSVAHHHRIEMTRTENNRKHFDSILIISFGFEMQRLDLKWALANGWFIRLKRWALASFCIFIYHTNATVSFRWSRGEETENTFHVWSRVFP